MPDKIDAIMEEFNEITTLEGFTSLCMELKSEMAFYDQSALVALVTGVMEGFLVNALAWAALRDDPTYEGVEGRLDHQLRELPELLRRGRASIDTRALVERYVREGLPALQSAFAAEKGAFRSWMERPEEEDGDVDALVAEARLAADRGEQEQARGLVGRAGALVLRGRRLRPVWLRIAGPITGWVNGLFAIREAMILHPELPFPLTDPDVERAVAAAPRVVDFRTWREDVEDGLDDVDEMWSSILSDTPVVRREDLELLETQGTQALPVLTVLARSPEFRRTKAAFVALAQLRGLKSPYAVETFLQVVRDVDPDDPLFLEAKKGLLSLGPEAKGSVFAYLDDECDLNKQVSLGEIVARYRGDERAFRILTGLFKKTEWSQGKEVIARCLGFFGDPRAVPVLDEALASAGAVGDVAHRRAVSQAIRRLTKGSEPARLS